MAEAMTDGVSLDKVKEMSIYERLHQMMIDVDYVQKEQKRGGVPYTYVSHDAVTRKVRTAAIKWRVIIIPDMKGYDVSGNRVEITGVVRFVNVDNPDDEVRTTQLGFGVDKQDKGPGKAMSYLVKYAMLKVLGLETGDDPENDNIDHDPVGVIRDSQITEIERLLKLTDKTIDLAFKHYGVSSYQELNANEADAIIRSLQRSVKSTS